MYYETFIKYNIKYSAICISFVLKSDISNRPQSSDLLVNVIYNLDTVQAQHSPLVDAL